jgi:hypothetical protein
MARKPRKTVKFTEPLPASVASLTCTVAITAGVADVILGWPDLWNNRGNWAPSGRFYPQYLMIGPNLAQAALDTWLCFNLGWDDVQELSLRGALREAVQNKVSLALKIDLAALDHGKSFLRRTSEAPDVVLCKLTELNAYAPALADRMGRADLVRSFQMGGEQACTRRLFLNEHPQPLKSGGVRFPECEECSDFLMFSRPDMPEAQQFLTEEMAHVASEGHFWQPADTKSYLIGVATGLTGLAVGSFTRH